MVGPLQYLQGAPSLRCLGRLWIFTLIPPNLWCPDESELDGFKCWTELCVKGFPYRERLSACRAVRSGECRQVVHVRWRYYRMSGTLPAGTQHILWVVQVSDVFRVEFELTASIAVRRVFFRQDCDRCHFPLLFISGCLNTTLHIQNATNKFTLPSCVIYRSPFQSDVTSDTAHGALTVGLQLG